MPENETRDCAEFNMIVAPKKVLWVMISVMGVLTLMSISGHVILYFTDCDAKGFQWYLKQFGVEEEHNFPTFFSSVFMGFCSFLLEIVYSYAKSNKTGYHVQWGILSLVFAYMAVDELLMLHERITTLTQPVLGGARFFYPGASDDAMPGLIVMIIFVILYFKSLLSVPKKTLFLFLLAGALFVGGAIGLEILYGHLKDYYVYTKVGHCWFDVFGQQRVLFAVLLDLEEVAEMAGLTVFAYALLSYLESNTTGMRILWSKPER